MTAQQTPLSRLSTAFAKPNVITKQQTPDSALGATFTSPNYQAVGQP